MINIRLRCDEFMISGVSFEGGRGQGGIKPVPLSLFAEKALAGEMKCLKLDVSLHDTFMDGFYDANNNLSD